MISQTAEYALRAVVYLASAAGVPRTTSQISEATAAPTGYLSKVMQGLSRARLVTSRRGLHGGFTLAVSAERLSLLDVVNAVDAMHRIDRCPLGREVHDDHLCPLHSKVDSVLAAAETAFRDTTVAELLHGNTGQNVCHFPGISDQPIVSLEANPPRPAG